MNYVVPSDSNYDKIIVTVLTCFDRLRSGVPATLATTCLLNNTCEALLTPYPCLTIQEQGKPGDLQNAVDLFLDGQDILWVLDTGIVQTLDSSSGPLRTGPPTVWAFDLNTRKVSGIAGNRGYENFPSISSSSFLSSFILRG